MSRRALRPHRLARLALLLWLPVAGGLVFLGIRGGRGPAPTVDGLSPAGDGRQPIVVSPADALVISQVMRDNLAGLLQIQQAAAEGNMAALSRAADSWAASPGPARLSPTLEQQLPRQWRAMGFQVHESLRLLADEARIAETTPETVAARLSDTVGACVACHGTYRLVVLPDGAGPADP